MFTPLHEGRVRPLTLACLALAAVTVALAGCDPLGEFRQREVSAKFESGTSRNVRMEVRADCGELPRVTPVPVNSDAPRVQRVRYVRYDVDDASTADLARLYQCLTEYPSVTGVSKP